MDYYCILLLHHRVIVLPFLTFANYSPNPCCWYSGFSDFSMRKHIFSPRASPSRASTKDLACWRRFTVWGNACIIRFHGPLYVTTAASKTCPWSVRSVQISSWHVSCCLRHKYPTISARSKFQFTLWHFYPQDPQFHLNIIILRFYLVWVTLLFTWS